MNFLDPENWADLKALEAEYEELNDEKLADLRGRLKPYFLRRIKSDVMDLPPKVSETHVVEASELCSLPRSVLIL